MIDRYTRPEMGKLWSQENRFHWMLEVEKAVAQAQADLSLIPKAAAQAIQKRGSFDVERIAQIEKTTRHDVIAFVSNVAENVGPHGRYVHYGMTSSDVLDTALSLQLREAWNLLAEGIDDLRGELRRLVKRHADTLCAGRTHGMHAEPTTFGLKLSGFLAEVERNQMRLQDSMAQAQIGKLSGAVGTYSAQPVEVEARVCELLQLTPETIATQVIPRDRHAQVIFALASYMSGLERLALELRHLQRTEVSEVCEGFGVGQKGSSAMPHKKNPISAENLAGLSRLVRSYVSAALENIVLWHERDISHSSVERVMFPDVMILADYATHRMKHLLADLSVDAERMHANMESSQGKLFSSHVLLSLVDQGMSREEAYKIVQECSHSLKPNEHLKEKLMQHNSLKEHKLNKVLADIFSGKKHQQSIGVQIQKFLKQTENNSIAKKSGQNKRGKNGNKSALTV